MQPNWEKVKTKSEKCREKKNIVAELGSKIQLPHLVASDDNSNYSTHAMYLQCVGLCT